MIEKPVNTTLKIPNSLAYLPLCSAFIENNARLIGFLAEEVQAISLATEEALSNTIQHSYAPGQYDTIEINCWQTPLGIEIIIKEKGMPFDTKAFPDFDLSSIGTGDAQGLGLYLIKQTVDEVIFTNRGSEGNETHLIKYITQCPIDDIINKTPDNEGNSPVEFKHQVKFTIRQLAEGEAIEVSRAIYRVYGYNYFNEHAYYPERIERLNKSGNLDTVAAVTEDNVFAGTCALYRVDLRSDLGELEQAVVLPEYRGNHCMVQLLEYLQQIAREKNLVGLYAKSETSKLYAQRALERFGTHDCALLLGFTNKLVWDDAHKEKTIQRESFVLTYLPLREEERKTLYVPEHHLAMVNRIYDNIGYKREYEQPKRGKDPLDENSKLDVKHFYNTSTAVIKVERYGRDIISKLKKAKKEAKLKKFAVVYLYLSMENPYTVHYFEKIEQLDFFFAGILPYDISGDAIILQYLNNIEIKTNKLDLYSRFARELAEYIQQCREKDPLRLLIDSGESDKLEFKSTLRWNLKSNKRDSRMEYAVLKTVAAYLNTDGGTLLVGVEDDGNIIGYEIDKFSNEDKYLLHFSHLIQHNIGLDNSRSVFYKLVELEGQKILKVDCIPAVKPIFIRSNGEECFYIRSGPASKKLTISEAVSYISKKFDLS